MTRQKSSSPSSWGTLIRYVLLFDTTYEFRDVGQKDTVLHALRELFGTEVQAVRSFVSGAVPFSTEHAASWLRNQKPDTAGIDLFLRACPATRQVSVVQVPVKTVALVPPGTLPIATLPLNPNSIILDAYIIYVGSRVLCDYPIKLDGVIKLNLLLQILKDSTPFTVSCVPLHTRDRKPRPIKISLVIEWMLRQPQSKELVLARLIDVTSSPEFLTKSKSIEPIEKDHVVQSQPRSSRAAHVSEEDRKQLEIWGRKTESDGISAPNERKAAIRKIIEERGIKCLIHFTRLENLPSILERGILSRVALGDDGYVWNDAWRRDKRKHAICLSISYPNYAMFHSYKSGSEEKWAVLLLDPAILWELDCGFVEINAASRGVPERPESDLKSLAAFQSMFSQTELRSRLHLESYYPTNPQTEVLVFEHISSKYIREICLKFKPEAKSYRDGLGRIVPTSEKASLFKYRQDWAHWKKPVNSIYG